MLKQYDIMFIFNGKITLIRLIIKYLNAILSCIEILFAKQKKKEMRRDVFFKGGNKIPELT